uniref:Usp domain-containing protein n=1 Tax=Macrostomum lignano TaxID=282301 RepID=A0A1I8FHL3_9PLAT
GDQHRIAGHHKTNGCSTKAKSCPLFKRNENITLALELCSEPLAALSSKVGLLADVNLAGRNSELRALFGTSEASIEDIRSLAPEQLLMKWVNYHLERGPEVNGGLPILATTSRIARPTPTCCSRSFRRKSGNGMHSASDILQQREHQTERSWCCKNAELVDARVFVQPSSDIVAGNSNLNLAFVANLFHKFPSLAGTRRGRRRGWPPGRVGAAGVGARTDQRRRKSRWIWRGRAARECNYAVELGRQVRFSLRGIGGEDLLEGQPAAAGTRIDERAIIAWANQRLERGSKSAARLIIRSRIWAIADARPGTACKMPNWPSTLAGVLVQRSTPCQRTFVEVKPKMVMTIFACLMQLDFESPATVKLAASPVHYFEFFSWRRLARLGIASQQLCAVVQRKSIIEKKAMKRKILIAMDGSENSRRALRWYAQNMNNPEDLLIFVFITDPPSMSLLANSVVATPEAYKRRHRPRHRGGQSVGNKNSPSFVQALGLKNTQRISWKE